MNRIEQKLQILQEKDEKAFITYMTAGLPSMEGTKEIIKAQEEAGANIVELGIPFSDPIADGPIIQAVSYKSIQLGTNLKNVLKMVSELREEGCQIPIVFVMYYNTVLYHGIKEFTKSCADSGVDGLIIPDLPFEEQGELQEALKTTGEATILIQMITPLSGKRIPMILEKARGFVYCIPDIEINKQSEVISDYLKEVRSISKIPVMLEDIYTSVDAKLVKNSFDGIIISSYLVELMENCNYDVARIREYIKANII